MQPDGLLAHSLWRAGSAAEDGGTSRADLKESRPERAGLLSETSRQSCHVLVHIFYLRKPLRGEGAARSMCLCARAWSSGWKRRNALIKLKEGKGLIFELCKQACGGKKMNSFLHFLFYLYIFFTLSTYVQVDSTRHTAQQHLTQWRFVKKKTCCCCFLFQLNVCGEKTHIN